MGYTFGERYEMGQSGVQFQKHTMHYFCCYCNKNVIKPLEHIENEEHKEKKYYQDKFYEDERDKIIDDGLEIYDD